MALSRSELLALAQTDVSDRIPPEALAAALTAPPFIPSRSLINLRDAGAVPGSALAPARVFRSGGLDHAAADPDALAWLARSVSRVFDLRTPEERDAGPDPDVPGVLNVWMPSEGQYPRLELAAFAVDGGRPAWRQQYMTIAMIYRPIFRAVLEHVRDRPAEPFLIHCTAGRDRTGVLVGLLQALAGTAPDDVVFDYLLSRVGIEPAREILLKYAMASVGITDVAEPGFHDLVALRADYWAAFLEELQERFGGWEGYTTEVLGFSKEDLETIRGNLRK